MKSGRWLALGLGVGLLLSLAPSCGTAEPCGPASCFGCCDATGTCQTGTLDDGCGTNGGACSACAAAEVCQLGACQAVSGGLDAGQADAGFDAGLPLEPTNPLGFTVSSTPDPVRRGMNTLAVLIKGANGVPVPKALLQVKVWMTAMGHGSTAPTITENGGGEYTVSNVNFTMGGTWDVTLTAFHSNHTGQRVISYSVP